jgi:hypothetical protein
MRIKYDGRTYLFPIGKHYNYTQKQFKITNYVMRRWGNLMIEAQPRYGKSVIAKDLAIKMSKKRKIIIFDFSAEWTDNITKYNMWAPYPDKLVSYKVLQGFTFNVMEFNNDDDYASMGFTGMHAAITCSIITQSVSFHQGNIDLIGEMLGNLPIKRNSHYAFNNSYGTKLTSPINFATRSKICTHWDTIKRYFWQGEQDKRMIYDFAKEAKNSNHLIIDLSAARGTIASEWIARAYAGKILEQLKTVWSEIKPVMFFEESRTLFPSYEGEIALSSNDEAYDLVTHGPKNGVCCVFIVQHQNQIYPKLLENIQMKIVGVVQKPGSGPEYSVSLTYDPGNNVREFVYMDVDSTAGRFKYKKFRPMIPCMEYRSER